MKNDLFLQMKSNITKKMDADFKYKADIKNKHYEINRANKTMKSLVERITELQVEIHNLEERKSALPENKETDSEQNI